MHEGGCNFPAGCDMAEHYVVTVGIYTSAAAFPAIHPDAMLPAIVKIHLSLDVLVTPENNRRRHLPHEEIFPAALPREKFLHRQEKRKFLFFPCESFGKFGVNHNVLTNRRYAGYCHRQLYGLPKGTHCLQPDQISYSVFQHPLSNSDNPLCPSPGQSGLPLLY